MQHTVRSATPAIATALAVSAASLLTGCDAGSDIMAPLALPSSQIKDTQAQSGVLPSVAASPQQGRNGQLVVSSQQQAYLDALREAGVNPSSDLLALSIGSHVCQARAAKQNDQAVWDFVLPLVRSDVRTAHSGDGGVEVPGEVNAATSDYIRIATERLC
ncbi:hypothetical protein H7J87_08750 [Mycolicibacterium wolinskyi]|uniref:DUF732 domain-containing protein n=1 Tax=Mycolicibacterium wolinskyi TaxID=59750 RepID=A0A132PFZ3_9MYCO|nr:MULTISPECIES: DUF732 domain-containing protein [Mycolicibacterium]KWX21279.1 hypothetical protein AFM11_26755 [Mycolicibacterium wolinskyi]MCV7285414.1 hypothetical protein [Mycolicibacterium wolinskyi]MCV7295083.1 hypothetical protein [Mycolicibacterium goodii]ORX15686.1 hypothetical protein AWC31_22580 [Mycolicibacterium wolinskyi]